MEKQIRNCQFCKKGYEVFRSKKKGSNGAYLLYDAKDRLMQGKVCLSCFRERANASWCDEKRAKHKSYEKTPRGYIMRKYRNMKSRITGVQKQKYHLYKGLTLLSKEDFYEWAIDHKDFISLFSDYEASGYERKLAPSVDRIDSDKGYEISNMEWVTHSENSRRGSNSEKRRAYYDAMNEARRLREKECVP